jgi:hypothetical protein
VLFIILGNYGFESILSKNPCIMTKTHKIKSIVEMPTTTTSSYKLWKLSNPFTEKLNYQPVIFIPGHLGK